MKLYHYTDTLHIPFIKEAGALTFGDIPLLQTSNYGESGHAVWLTTRDYARRNEHGLISPICDKTQVRFTINLPKDDSRLFKWSDYAKINDMDQDWYRVLDKAGGYLADTWWLYIGPIAIDGLEVAHKINDTYVPVHIDGIPPSPYAQNAKLTHMGVAVPV
jgi:hypothetical protein